jgi:hypothetical protein
MLSPDTKILIVYPNFEIYKQCVDNIVYDSKFLPLDISYEIAKLKDLLEVSYFKYSLFEVSQLHAIMLFEKALRIKLYKEYKTITKIKFSVLLDKALQLSLINQNTVNQFRILKDIRNKTVHHGFETVDVEDVLKNISLLIYTVHQLFPAQDIYFLVSFSKIFSIENDIKKLRYSYTLEDMEKFINTNNDLYVDSELIQHQIIKMDRQGNYFDLTGKQLI